MYRLEEAARELNISAETLRREIRRGRIAHRREGMRRIVFDAEFLEQYKQRNTTEAKS